MTDEKLKDAWGTGPIANDRKRSQGLDSDEVKARSKRMFGLMVGTLNKLKEKDETVIY